MKYLIQCYLLLLQLLVYLQWPTFALDFDMLIRRLDYFCKSPKYIGAKFLNLVNNNIKSINNKKTFKRKLKEYLTNLRSYSFSEFEGLNYNSNS